MSENNQNLSEDTSSNLGGVANAAPPKQKVSAENFGSDEYKSIRKLKLTELDSLVKNREQQRKYLLYIIVAISLWLAICGYCYVWGWLDNIFSAFKIKGNEPEKILLALANSWHLILVLLLPPTTIIIVLIKSVGFSSNSHEFTGSQPEKSAGDLSIAAFFDALVEWISSKINK